MTILFVVAIALLVLTESHAAQFTTHTSILPISAFDCVGGWDNVLAAVDRNGVHMFVNGTYQNHTPTNIIKNPYRCGIAGVYPGKLAVLSYANGWLLLTPSDMTFSNFTATPDANLITKPAIVGSLRSPVIAYNTALGNISIVDTSTGSYSTFAMSTPRDKLAATRCEDPSGAEFFFFIGGTGASRVVDVVDVSSRTLLATAQNMPTGRESPSCTCTSGNVLTCTAGKNAQGIQMRPKTVDMCTIGLGGILSCSVQRLSPSPDILFGGILAIGSVGPYLTTSPYFNDPGACFYTTDPSDRLLAQQFCTTEFDAGSIIFESISVGRYSYFGASVSFSCTSCDSRKWFVLECVEPCTLDSATTLVSSSTTTTSSGGSATTTTTTTTTTTSSGSAATTATAASTSTESSMNLASSGADALALPLFQALKMAHYAYGAYVVGGAIWLGAQFFM